MQEKMHRAIGHEESPHERSLSAALGHAVRITWLSSARSENIDSMCRRIWPAIALDQIEFLYDSRGIAVGFVTWGFLSDSSVECLKNDPSFQLHLSEWNEGTILWIMDLFALEGQAWNLVRKFKRNHLSTGRVVMGVRRYSGKKSSRFVKVNARCG